MNRSKKNSNVGRAPVFENMEARLLLDGNVLATVSGTTLLLKGDTDNNAITIQQTLTGFTVTGTNGTTVNSNAGDVAIAGAFKNVYFNMARGGDNAVTVEGDVAVDGWLKYVGGKGNDTFDAGSTVGTVFASGTVAFTQYAAEAADGTVNFVPVAGEAADGTVTFADVTGEAATGDFTFTEVVGAEATGEVGFTPVAGTEATGQYTFTAIPGAEATGEVDFSVVAAEAATADIVFTTIPGVEATGTIGFSAVVGVSAVATIELASDQNAANNETVLINDGDGNEYTFTFKDAANPFNLLEVQIGADAAETMTNLLASINFASTMDLLDLTASLDTTTITLTAATDGNRALWNVDTTAAQITVVDANKGTTAIDNVEVDDTVTIDDGTNAPVTFTFIAGASAGTDVHVGADAAESMANLQAAIDASALAGDLDLTTALDGTTITVTADSAGNRADWDISEVSATLGVSGVTQGVDAVEDVSVDDTVTIDDGVNAPVTYTFIAGASAGTDVQVGGDAATSMANLQAAIDASVLAGDLDLTTGLVGTTLTLTADVDEERVDWSVTEDAATLSTANVSIGQDAVENVDVDDTVTIDDGVNAPVTYTFIAGVSAGTDVQVGADAATSMANLQAAIDASVLAGDLDLTTGLVGTTLTLTASAAENRADWDVTTTGANITVDAANKGTDAVDNVEVDDTVTIDDGVNAPVTYTFIAGASAGTDVQVGADAATSMANLQAAIDASALAGDLDLTTGLVGTTLTLTADSAELRADWDLADDSATIGVAGVDTGVDAITNVSNGDTVVVDDGINAPITFTFVTGVPGANEVLIGADIDESMANLQAAIAGAGLNLTASVVDSTITLTADADGNRAAWDVTTTGANITVAADKGTDAVDNVEAGDTVTIDDGTNAPVTYTFVAAAPGAGDVLIGVDAATSMANLQAAIDASVLAGDLDLTTSLVDTTLTLTADADGERVDWSLTDVSATIGTANVSIGIDAQTNVAENDTVTIDDGVNAAVEFIFKAAANPFVVNEVQIGGTAAASMQNLLERIQVAATQDLLDVTAAIDGLVVTVTSETQEELGDWAVQNASDTLTTVDTNKGVTAITNVTAGDTVTIDDGTTEVTLTFVVGAPGANEVQIGADADASMANLQTAIDGAGLALTAVQAGNTVTLTADSAGERATWAVSTTGANITTTDDQGIDAGAFNPVAGNTVTVNDGTTEVTLTFVVGAPGANEVQIGADAVASMTNLRAAIIAAGLDLTTALTDAYTLGITADTAGLRATWDIAAVGANVTGTTVSQGAGVNPSLNVLDLIANMGSAGHKTVTLGTDGEAAGQITINRNATITAGTGDDTVTIRNANVAGKTTVSTGKGAADTISVLDSTLGNKVTVKTLATTGSTVLLQNSTLNNTLSLTTGAGADTITLDGFSNYNGKVTVNAGAGDDTLDTDSLYAVYSTFNMGAGTDLVTLLAGVDFADGVNIQRAHLTLG